MIKEGLRAGVPDVILAVPVGGYHGLFIEMKVEGRKASPWQLRWHERLKRYGYKVETCYGWEEAKDVILEYLKL